MAVLCRDAGKPRYRGKRYPGVISVVGLAVFPAAMVISVNIDQDEVAPHAGDTILWHHIIRLPPEQTEKFGRSGNDQGAKLAAGHFQLRVSDKAALVLINESAKSYEDLKKARSEIIGRVYDKFGYWLEQEPVEITA